MGKLWSVGWRAPVLFASMLLGTELPVTFMSGSLSPAKSEIFYQTGFEQPTFTPGPIVGQGGWAIYRGRRPSWLGIDHLPEEPGRNRCGSTQYRSNTLVPPASVTCQVV